MADPKKASAEQEPERPGDEHVTLSDTRTAPLQDPDPKADKAAAADDKSGTNPDDSAPTDADNKQPKPKGSQRTRKIVRLHRELDTAKAGTAKDKARIAELESDLETALAGRPAAGKPKITDYEDPEKYADDLVAWKGKQAKPKPAADPEPDPEPAPPPKSTIDKFTAAGKERLGEVFDAVWENSSSHVVSPEMGDFILASDVGPEIYVYLAGNEELAKQIWHCDAEMTTDRMEELETQAKAGEFKTTSKAEPEDDPTPPADKGEKQTKAPAPPKDQDGGGDDPLQADPAKESMGDYSARRRKEEAANPGGIY
jgi:hypothetical protein